MSNTISFLVVQNNSQFTNISDVSPEQPLFKHWYINAFILLHWFTHSCIPPNSDVENTLIIYTLVCIRFFFFFGGQRYVEGSRLFTNRNSTSCVRKRQ